MSEAHIEPVRAPRGATGFISVRNGTSDMSVVFSHFSNQWTEGDDEYDLRDLSLSGVFVDVGAHIGAVALAVLLDNPEARAITVEPFPENCALIRQTMAANSLLDRVQVIEAAVGSSDVQYGVEDDDNRYVGNLGIHTGPTIKAKVVTLASLVKMAGGKIDALKTDCEGGEWLLLDSPARSKVDLIFGEWHGHNKDFDGPQRLERLIGSTHQIVHLTDDGGVGLFRAVLR